MKNAAILLAGFSMLICAVFVAAYVHRSGGSGSIVEAAESQPAPEPADSTDYRVSVISYLRAIAERCDRAKRQTYTIVGEIAGIHEERAVIFGVALGSPGGPVDGARFQRTALAVNGVKNSGGLVLLKQPAAYGGRTFYRPVLGWRAVYSGIGEEYDLITKERELAVSALGDQCRAAIIKCEAQSAPMTKAEAAGILDALSEAVKAAGAEETP